MAPMSRTACCRETWLRQKWALAEAE
jgi:hypothetical protein